MKIKPVRTTRRFSVGDLRRDPDLHLTTEELCLLLGKSKAWADLHRARRTGVPFVKIGRTPYYAAGDVVAWLDAQRVNTGAAA